MNLRDLKYLVAVADNKHFGKAAQACFVSQPALSMQLQKLEGTLGVQLIERTNKNVLVTNVGKDIVERARKLLSEAEEIKEVAKLYQDPFTGEIRLGAFPTLAPYLFPTVVPEISKSLPKLKLLLIEEKTESLLQKIKDGSIDAALLAQPIEDEGLEILPLFDDPFLLATPTDHKLASKKHIDNIDLIQEGLLLLEEGHCLRSQALEVCSLTSIGERQDFRATSLETLRQMVISGVGITLIPKIATENHKNICYIPFKGDAAPSRSIALVFRKTSARKECFQKVAKIIRGSYKATPYT